MLVHDQALKLQPTSKGAIRCMSMEAMGGRCYQAASGQEFDGRQLAGVKLAHELCTAEGAKAQICHLLHAKQHPIMISWKLESNKNDSSKASSFDLDLKSSQSSHGIPSWAWCGMRQMEAGHSRCVCSLCELPCVKVRE